MTRNKPGVGLITILGAGFSGLAAGERLRELGYEACIYEKNDYVGGHAHSNTKSGYTFDEGPHVSFTKNHTIQKCFAEAVDRQFLEHDAKILNYWHKHLLSHPAQCHLYGLPPDILASCIEGFAKRRRLRKGRVKNYADWCYQNLGKAFSEEFVFRYTRKYWTAKASQMTTDWMGARIYRPTLEEVIKGGLFPNDDNYHYITKIRYPKRGGFGEYIKAVSPNHCVRLGLRAVMIDSKKKEITFSDQTKSRYKALISSLPLPELIKIILNVPAPVVRAAKRLIATSLVLVNLGIRRRQGFPNAHWMYFYDDDIVFSRVSFPHHLSPHNAPNGCGSIQAEVYHSKYKPLRCKNVARQCIEDLHRTRILRKDDKITFLEEKKVPYANILSDHNKSKAVKIVKDYLKKLGIIPCGRYGEWGHLWTDDSILSGRNAADKAVAIMSKQTGFKI